MIWDDDATRELRAIWEERTPDGRFVFSTAALGRHFNTTKNSVVGKAHRLELTKRPTPIRYQGGLTPPDTPHRARAIVLPPALPPLPSLAPILPLSCEEHGPPPPPIMGRPTPIGTPWRIEPAKIKPSPVPTRAEIRPAPAPQPRPHGRVINCLWPVGEVKHPEFRFCGDKSEPGRVYCAEHSKLAFVVVRYRPEDVK